MSAAKIIATEFRRLLRGRLPLAAVLIGLPLAFTVLFGFVYEENTVRHIPLAVYDEDQSPLSRTFVQMYADSEKFVAASYVESQEDAHAEIFAGRAKAALCIPADFAENIKRGKGTDALLIVNSANNMFGNAAIAAAQEINRSFSVAVAQKLMEGMNLLPSAAMAAVYPVRMGVRIAGNPVNGYGPFMLSGLLLNGLQIGIMIALAPILCDELARRREKISIGEIFLLSAKLVPYWCFAFAGYVLSLFCATNFFAVPMRGSLFAAMLTGGAFIVFVMGAILVFSACSPNRIMALQAPMLYIMPGLLYSGLSWPSFDMNEGALMFSLLLPMSYAGDTLRDVLLVGFAPRLWQDCGAMLLGGLLAGAAAFAIFLARCRRRQRKEASLCE